MKSDDTQPKVFRLCVFGAVRSLLEGLICGLDGFDARLSRFFFHMDAREHVRMKKCTA